MKIYTKTGDGGKTSLATGLKVSKDEPLLEAYGSVDELNSLIGLCRAEGKIAKDLDQSLERIQNELFDVGADLATPWNEKIPSQHSTVRRILPDWTTHLEKEIDLYEKELEPIRNFILPGGTKASAVLHVARTVCRRAERWTVSVCRGEQCNPEAIIYLNRLSDWLFVAARLCNRRSKTDDVIWKQSAVKET